MPFGLFPRLFPYIALHKWRVAGVIASSFALAAIGGMQVGLIRPLFDQGLGPNGTLEEAQAIGAKLLGLGILNFPCRFYHFYWLRYVMDQAACSVRTKIFDKFLRLPTSSFTESKRGQMVSNVINDTHIFAEGFKATTDLIREPLKAIVYFSMALWADWQLTLVVIVATPLFLLIFHTFGRKVSASQSVVQQEHGEITHNTSEGLSAIKVIKAFNLEKFVFGRFVRSQKKYFGAQMRTTLFEELSHPFVELVGAMAFGGVIVFAYYRITSGAITTGGFISFITALALFMDPIRKFSQANVRMSQSWAASERIYRLFNLPEERIKGPIRLDKLEREIVIRNLYFSYGDGEVIRNLNLTIKKGQKIGLVGSSGSGKSTLIGLLLGLYSPDKGEILIDGHNLKQIDLHSLRNLFGLVSQDIFLFHDTVRENLTIGRNISEQDIEKALKVSHSDKFVQELPEGMETLVGDQGMRLSGGQQQRLTIARAFLQHCDVLLFDEATSALDNESEKVVQQALDNLAGEKTVIAVAHRLSTIRDYDYIYVLRQGRLTEQGTHRELLLKGGEYSKLYQLSSG